jgi:PQQ-dependent catabolism-associated CXXCW motif protein
MDDQDKMLAPPPPRQAGAIDASPAGATDIGDAPYPGLRSFRREETHIFFGREGTVNQMVDGLAVHRFLAVTGASGSGKSSLVRTGLLDALDRGLLAEVGANWRVADFRPGDRPLKELTKHVVAAIDRAFSNEECALIEAELARGPLGLVKWLDEINFSPSVNLLLLADQFEELFRYRRGTVSEEAEAFVALLLASTKQRNRRIYVVITMRSDFLGECARFYGLAEAINDGQFLTPRLTRDQCREAIEGPAKVYGGRVEKALVTRLLNDMGSNPDQLPLMQHVLMLMWRRYAKARSQDGEPVLTLGDYEALGGIVPETPDEGSAANEVSPSPRRRAEGALSKHADQTLKGDQTHKGLTSEQQRLARIFFCALIQTEGNIGRDVRRPASLREIAQIAEVNWEDFLPIVEAFRAPGRNFLTPPPPALIKEHSVIDISHESLIRQWGTLRDWVEEEFQSAQWYRDVLRTAKREQKGEAGLLRMPELGSVSKFRQAAGWNAPWAARYGGDYDLAASFLAASEKRDTVRRRVWNSIKAFVAALVIGGGVYSYQANQQTQLALEEAKREAQEAKRAEETYGVPPQSNLTENIHAPTPLWIPDGRVLQTSELIELITKQKDLMLIDVLPGDHASIPNAIRIPYARNHGSFDDEAQRRFAVRLDKLTHGNRDAKLVIFCGGRDCWMSYNACLRAIRAGYRQVSWYRGGLSAWRSEGLRKTARLLESVQTIEQRLSSDKPQDARNDAVTLFEAAEALLGSDANAALAAASQGRDTLQSLMPHFSNDPDFLYDLAASYDQLAQVYARQDESENELAAYREAEKLLRTIAHNEPTDLTRQYDLANLLIKKGRRFNRQKIYNQATSAFNEAQTMLQPLVEKQTDNYRWRHELWIAYYTGAENFEDDDKLDDAIVAYGGATDIVAQPSEDRAASLSRMQDYVFAKYGIGEILSNSKSYDKAVANYDGAIETVNGAIETVDKMIENEENGAEWRHYLSLLQNKKGDALKAYRKLDAASEAYRAAANAAKSAREIYAQDKNAPIDLNSAVIHIGNLTYEFILAHEFDKALKAVQFANSLVPSIIWIEAYRAHALMFLERNDEAWNIYRKYRGKMVSAGETWEEYVLKNFKDFRERNLSRPLMQDIEKRFGAPE